MSGRWFDPKKKTSMRQRLTSFFARFSAQSGTPRRNNSSMLRLMESGAFYQIKIKILNWTLAFGHWFQLSALPILRRFNWKMIQGILSVMVGTFFLASSISTFAANSILSLTRADSKSVNRKPSKIGASDLDGDGAVAVARVALGSPPVANTVSIRKDILSRNLFNAEGKLAPEANKDESKSIRKDLSLDFDRVECTTGELPVQINGTIFTGDPLKSFVILKDPKIADADIYKPGDAIIDYEDFEIYKVERGVLEVRKGNSKICVTISGYGNKSEISGESGSGAAIGKSPGESKEFEFDAAFISQEIGPGYATILNCAKLIPEIDPSGKMQGFKMISIATSCLFDRVQIQNGDVVTEVNGVSLKDPGQGFKLYQSLQEERTTTINIIRNGEPITRIIRVK